MDVMSQGHLLNGSSYEPHHLLEISAVHDPIWKQNNPQWLQTKRVFMLTRLTLAGRLLSQCRCQQWLSSTACSCLLTPPPQAAAVPPMQSLFSRDLPSLHQQFLLLLSPSLLPIHPNHNFNKEQHTAQGCAVARVPRTGLTFLPLLMACLILPIFRQQHQIQVWSHITLVYQSLRMSRR